MTLTRRFVVIAMLTCIGMLCGCVCKAPVAPVVPAVPAATTHLECLLKAHQPDGSLYVTSQKQEAAPAESYIRVYGKEPEGSYDWQLNSGMIQLSGSLSSDMKWLPAEMSTIDYCRLVLASLGSSPVSDVAARPVRVLGNWATPVASRDGLTWYSSSKSLKAADVVAMPGPDGSQIVARTYGSIATKGSESVPAKLEIYLTSDAAADRLLLELDYIE